MFGIIIGISEPQYNDKELKQFKNATVKLNGKEIPYYEATQKQRAIENNIRKTTRSIKILEKAAKNKKPYSAIENKVGILSKNKITRAITIIKQ